MSALIVSKAHIDAMVTAAASPGAVDGGLRWESSYDLDLRHVFEEQGYEAYLKALSAHRRKVSYGDLDRCSEVGMMLWRENLASVQYRYDERDGNELPGPRDFTPSQIAAYRFKRTDVLSPVVILNAIAYYEYQSCEHPGWQTSEARSFCEALRHKMIDRLPGMDEAPWGLAESDVRPSRVYA